MAIIAGVAAGVAAYAGKEVVGSIVKHLGKGLGVVAFSNADCAQAQTEINKMPPKHDVSLDTTLTLGNR